MAKKRRQYAQEFKQETVRLMETSGKNVAQVARELGINDNVLYRWRREFGANAQRTVSQNGQSVAELEAEPKGLRRENEVLRTPVRVPKASAVCERFLGTVRRECLHHLLILSERQLHQVTKEYLTYFNSARPHQGIGHRIPVFSDESKLHEPSRARIIALPILGGLRHDYRRSA